MQAATPSVEALIRERIRAAGAISFAEYMDLALYHPQFGYYTSGAPKVGWAGDFFTSAHLHPLFGACVARQLRQMWQALKRPQPFLVVEEGAAQGVLARHIESVARQIAPEMAAALRYQTVEVERSAGEEMAAAPHVILSNELIDAFPVHVVESSRGQLQEIYVTEYNGRLVEQVGPPSSEALVAYLDRFHVDWKRFGLIYLWRAEINLRALEWMRATAARLAPGGFALTIDYGDTARRLYTSRRRRGTLLCYSRHTTNEEPLARPGQQDMTAHVNFSALIEEGRRAGLRRSRFTTQREFLLGWGIREEVEALRATRYAAADSQRSTDQGQADLLRYYSQRNAVNALLDPNGLGGFRVLIQRKG